MRAAHLLMCFPRRLLVFLSLLLVAALVASFVKVPPVRAAEGDLVLTITAAEIGVDAAAIQAVLPQVQAEVTQAGGLSDAIKQDIRNNATSARVIDPALLPDFDGTVSLGADGASLVVTVPDAEIQATVDLWHGLVAGILGLIAGLIVQTVCTAALTASGVGAGLVPVVCNPMGGGMAGFITGLAYHGFEGTLRTGAAWMEIFGLTIAGAAVPSLWETIIQPWARGGLADAFATAGNWVKVKGLELGRRLGAAAAAAVESVSNAVTGLVAFVRAEIQSWGATPPAPLTPLPATASVGRSDIRRADPSVIRVGGTYHSVESYGGHLYVRSASDMLDLSDSPPVRIWANPGMAEIWAPEITQIGGRFYVYFSAGAGTAHRMYVIGSASPSSGYGAAQKLDLPDDRWAIDGAAFTFNDQLWFVWSGWEGTDNIEQNLYLARMNNPTTPTGPRYTISQPREGWERVVGFPYVNESPQPILDPNGQLHIVYSANGSWTEDYCLADLRLRAGGDPANVWDWYKSNGCLLGSNSGTMLSGYGATQFSNGPGHHTFALPGGDIAGSPPAGVKTPFMYHGVPKSMEYRWENRVWLVGGMTWWNNITYARQNVPGANTNTGYSLGFYEDSQSPLPNPPVVTPPPPSTTPPPAGGGNSTPGLVLKNADPSVIRVGSTYHSVESDGNNIYSRSATSTSGLGSATRRLIWSAPKNMPNLWAPEMVRLEAAAGTHVYAIYFASGDGAGGQRMYYTWSNSPGSGFSDPIELDLPDDKWAVDGTAFYFGGKMWFVWSGWAGDDNIEQNLYIAEMTSPSDITGERHIISQPREPWERVVGSPFVNEAPQPVRDPNGQLHITYSANGSWSDQYCIADLRLRAGGDPTNVWDWYKSNGCQFGSNQNSMMNGWHDTLYVNGPGSHSFVLLNGDIGTSPPAGAEFPLMYHAVPKGTPYSWGNRNWYAGSFMWWGDSTYSRANAPGAASDTGFGLKFFEQPPTGGAPGQTAIKNADPSVIRVDSTYYSVESDGGALYVRQAASTDGLAGGVRTQIWTGNGLGEVWAPELVRIGGRYHVYFSAGAGGAHRMYVISSAQPNTGYGGHQKLALPDDKWAVDGTAFTFNDQLWFVWSGWEGDSDIEQNLYIVRMSSPTTPTGARFIISQPREPWERFTSDPFVNEAPQPLRDPNGQLHITYSANGSWTDQYCIADLRLRAGGDPTNVWDWYKSNGCQFGSNPSAVMNGWEPTLYVNGPGSHSFVLLNGDIATSPPAGSKFPLMYHAVPKGTPYSWANRLWHTGSFVWWGDSTYTRANAPGAASSTGFGLKYFE